MLIPDPELSPDLEWLVQGTQGSADLLIETACRDYGTQIYQLASALVGKSAETVLHRTLLAVVHERRRYLHEMGPRIWVLKLALQECQKIHTPVTYPAAQSTSSQQQATWEADLWMTLDDLEERLRLPVVLHFVCDLNLREISHLLGTPEKAALNRLKTARIWLASALQSAGGTEDHQELDTRIRKSLQARWPLPVAGALELEQACNVAVRMVRNSSLHSQRNGRMREIALVGMILVMVVGGSWLTRLISAGSQAAPRPVFVTRVVQMVITRTAAPTATPVPTRPPLQSLLFNASQENIRQRIQLNRSLWQSAYIEAQFVRYGPPGYIGPPRLYRNQLWIQNPGEQMKERILILTGSVIEPSRAILTGDGDVYEVDLTTGQAYKSVLDEPQLDPFFSMSQMFMMGDERLRYSGILDGSVLMQMLFSTFLADSESELNILYYDRMLDRDTLVIETKRNGMPLERYWVDADFGMVLRWQRFGGQEPVVTEEIAVTTLDFDAKFPDQILSPTFHWRSPLEWDVVRRDAIPGRNFADPLSLRPRLETQEQPPSNFDPASNSLTLQWSLTGRAGLVAGTSAEIYSDGYRLGPVKMGNPWNVVCKRSPDGRRIAFLEPAGVEQEVAYFAQYGPFWLDLEDPSTIHNALPNAELVGSDFAFSPDGQKLAFWGCAASPTNCGIYIHDLNTRKNLKLAAMDNGAIYIMWSPDGKQLGYFGPRGEQAHRISFIVLDIEYGQILLESPTLAWPDNHIPLEAPQWARDALPTLGQTGLTDCLRNMQP